MTVKELLDRLPEGGHVLLVKYTEDTQSELIGEWHDLYPNVRAAGIVIDNEVSLAKDNYGVLGEVVG